MHCRFLVEEEAMLRLRFLVEEDEAILRLRFLVEEEEAILRLRFPVEAEVNAMAGMIFCRS